PAALSGNGARRSGREPSAISHQPSAISLTAGKLNDFWHRPRCRVQCATARPGRRGWASDCLTCKAEGERIRPTAGFGRREPPRPNLVRDALLRLARTRPTPRATG